MNRLPVVRVDGCPECVPCRACAGPDQSAGPFRRGPLPGRDQCHRGADGRPVTGVDLPCGTKPPPSESPGRSPGAVCTAFDRRRSRHGLVARRRICNRARRRQSSIWRSRRQPRLWRWRRISFIPTISSGSHRARQSSGSRPRPHSRRRQASIPRLPTPITSRVLRIRGSGRSTGWRRTSNIS